METIFRVSVVQNSRLQSANQAAHTNVNRAKEYYKQQLKYGSGLNARSEKLFDYWLYEKSAFTKRCIIPVSGFFEPHEYNNKKFPIHIKRGGFFFDVDGFRHPVNGLKMGGKG